MVTYIKYFNDNDNKNFIARMNDDDQNRENLQT